MATLTVQQIVEAGLEATYSSCDVGGDTFANDTTNRTFIHVKNGDASEHTVTVTPQTTSKDVAGFGTMTKPNISVAITAGEDRFIGPFPVGAFSNAPAITYDAVTSMTIGVIKI